MAKRNTKLKVEKDNKPYCYTVLVSRKDKIETIENMRIEWTFEQAKNLCDELNYIIGNYKDIQFVPGEIHLKFKDKK